MFSIDHLRATERECGVRYPTAFWTAAAELQSLAGTPGFAVAFPGIRTVTERDVQAARELGMPESLVPFACESHPGHTDYYCCGPVGGAAVAVFAADAVVADWPSFGAFVGWMQAQVAGQRPAEPCAAADPAA